ncbi:YqgE/AlgH family protein [Oceanobacter mangrovi]|uniref:YqgE/AlgH family protein n=1 Tax=Oceanobacter mangrovi TaxID=2862510 RepID=UPI001C8E67F4|nr:YqgE/AlgH family protein [Oceanobacter mangrovi]
MRQLSSLKNQLLIAMPQLQDSWFEGTVTYLCEHDEHGAMGLVLNKPTNIDFAQVCDQLDIFRQPQINPAMLSGGPVSSEQGFILHNQQTDYQATLTVSPIARLTSSKDILVAIGKGEGPLAYRLALGYAGWSAGQLDEEILANSWLNVEADEELLFHTPTDQLYQTALARLGVSAAMLSDQAGHA